MQVGRCLEIRLAPEILQIFSSLFQEGVGVEVEVGCSVRELLTEQLGIPSDYVRGRITTIFLNRRAVDDPGTARIGDNALLTLSGAMPGLVGATMRSGGYYAAMRGAMTYREEGRRAVAGRGMITIKLFNLLLEELGPKLLRRGIALPAGRWKEFLARHPDNLRPLGYRIDGRPVPVERFACAGDFPEDGEVLRLRVHSGDE